MPESKRQSRVESQRRAGVLTCLHIYPLNWRTSGSETTSRLTVPGPRCALESRVYEYYLCKSIVYSGYFTIKFSEQYYFVVMKLYKHDLRAKKVYGIERHTELVTFLLLSTFPDCILKV